MRKPLVVALLYSAACGPAARDTTVDATSQGDAPAGDATVVDTSRIYAHSGELLYRLDGVTLSSTTIGPMAGIGSDSLLDLAVDQHDNMVGITRNKLFSLNTTTGAATLIRDLAASAQFLTSLSYVPQSLSDPTSPDILVSADDQGVVFQINPADGTASAIGSYGTTAAGQITSSGDLFGVRGLGIYATVNIGDEPQDYLARIDPSQNWKATPLGIGTGFDNIFGLGYWSGKIYGFVDNGFQVGGGKVIEIDPNTGAGTLLSSGNVRWFGAGVATDAPLL